MLFKFNSRPSNNLFAFFHRSRVYCQYRPNHRQFAAYKLAAAQGGSDAQTDDHHEDEHGEQAVEEVPPEVAEDNTVSDVVSQAEPPPEPNTST